LVRGVTVENKADRLKRTPESGRDDLLACHGFIVLRSALDGDSDANRGLRDQHAELVKLSYKLSNTMNPQAPIHFVTVDKDRGPGDSKFIGDLGRAFSVRNHQGDGPLTRCDEKSSQDDGAVLSMATADTQRPGIARIAN